MSMVTEHGGKGYAPLPQSMSNTDTDNDDDDLESRAVYSPDKNSHKSSHHDHPSVIKENGRFYPLDETKNLGNRMRNGRNNINLALGYCSDDIPIMVVDQEANDDLWKRPHMSFIRQFFLAASILLCIATILIFLYVLPCNDDDEVQTPPIKDRSALLWDHNLRGIELRGPISVLPGPPYDLIFMFRGQLFGDGGGEAQGPPVPARGGGVMSMHRGNGSLLWWTILPHSPTEIDCFNLDVDGSGKPDCVVAGEDGMLVSMRQIAGTVLWTSKAKAHSKIPVFLPDVDDDGIDDLLTVEKSPKESSGLAIISGKNGQLLGRHSRPDCRRIDIYSIDVNATVAYICHESNGKQSMKTISLTELINGVSLTRLKMRLAKKFENLPSPYIITDKNSDEIKLDLTPYHQLSIQRSGSCPGDLCLTTTNVTFQGKILSNESRSIWSSYGQNSYGMEPVSLTDTVKPLVAGFVMKFWQWNTAPVDSNQLDRINSSVTRRTITEWTSVVIINQTEVHAVNASQTDITQICKDSLCQPSLKLQSQSLLVSDLNHDGYRELISYQSSYELEREVFVLRSRVQAVRIDIEVAKLTQFIIV